MQMKNLKEFICIRTCSCFNVNDIALCVEEKENELILVTSANALRNVPKDCFKLNQERIEIKEVYCIYKGKKGHLNLNESYSVFCVMETNNNLYDIYYTIFDNTLRYKSWPSNYFIDKTEYDKLVEANTLDEYIKEVGKQLDYLNGVTTYLSEQELVVKTILQEVNKKTYLSKKPLNKEDYKETYSFSLPKGKKIIIKEPVEKQKNYEDGLRLCSLLDKINNLPFELLGKLQCINNNLIILEELNIEYSILKLIDESVHITLTLIEYDTNDETINNLNMFLDNTLEYIKQLRQNKHIEKEYIKNKLAENLNKTIEDNSELFKSMIADSEVFSQIYK